MRADQGARPGQRATSGPHADAGIDAASSRHEQLWHEHGGELVGYATLLVGPSDAGDVVALALERVARVATAPDSARPYLLRTITNLAIDQSRSQRRRRARELRVAVVDLVPAHESRLDVRRAIADLSVQQRAVVYHTYWDDLTSVQISALLGISPSAVRVHLARAHARLRKVLS